MSSTRGGGPRTGADPGAAADAPTGKATRGTGNGGGSNKRARMWEPEKAVAGSGDSALRFSRRLGEDEGREVDNDWSAADGRSGEEVRSAVYDAELMRCEGRASNRSSKMGIVAKKRRRNAIRPPQGGDEAARGSGPANTTKRRRKYVGAPEACVRLTTFVRRRLVAEGRDESDSMFNPYWTAHGQILVGCQSMPGDCDGEPSRAWSPAGSMAKTKAPCLIEEPPNP